MTELEQLQKTIGRRSFCTLATVSGGLRPHVAGVLYAAVGTTLYVNTERTSRKARNVAGNPHVAVCIPIRRVPVGGPPSTVQYQATADVLDLDAPEIGPLLAAGSLRKITSHGELELPGGCFLRIVPERRLHTYGLGMSLVKLIRDPLNASGMIELNASPGV